MSFHAAPISYCRCIVTFTTTYEKLSVKDFVLETRLYELLLNINKFFQPSRLSTAPFLLMAPSESDDKVTVESCLENTFTTEKP